MKRLLLITAAFALACSACTYSRPAMAEAKGSAAPEASVTTVTNAPTSVQPQPPPKPADATPPREQLFPARMFKLVNAPVREALQLHRAFSGLELDIEPSVDAAGGRVNLQVDRDLTRQEAITVLERTLLAQAGVRIVRTGARRATVTHVEGNLLR